MKKLSTSEFNWNNKEGETCQYLLKGKVFSLLIIIQNNCSKFSAEILDFKHAALCIKQKLLKTAIRSE